MFGFSRFMMVAMKIKSLRVVYIRKKEIFKEPVAYQNYMDIYQIRILQQM